MKAWELEGDFRSDRLLHQANPELAPGKTEEYALCPSDVCGVEDVGEKETRPG